VGTADWSSSSCRIATNPPRTGDVRPGRARPASHGFFVDDRDATAAPLDALGFPQAQIGWATNRTRFAFHDAQSWLGHYTEINPPAPRTKAFYQMVREAADGWDGKNVIASVQ
jgi:hypothetical protein